ncbi:MAG: ABC transporter substrate-binding protein [Candidatus Bathyarchaeota archaeon]|nr:ABC transporter substrate-binding protein [Candidatus Bathyarchaeota archaeon]
MILGKSLVAVFWVVFLAGFVYVVVFQQVEEPEHVLFNGSVIGIGYIEMWDNYSRCAALFDEIIEPEVNRYAEEMGSDVRFDYMVVHADDSGSSLERVQEFNHVGVRYVIGTNCVACTSYSYIEYNDMMLVSSRSRQPDFNIVDEHMFRICPHDGDQGNAIVRVLEARNISRVCVLRRGDGWGDAVFKVFSEEFGGEVLVDVRYAAESVEFSDELTRIEGAISGVDSSGVGLLVLSFAEVEEIVAQASGYPSVLGVSWFGTDATANLDESQYVDSIEGFEQVGLYSVAHTIEHGEKWDWLASSYMNLTGVYPVTRVGYDYDAAWLYALTLLEAESFDRSVLAETMPRVGAGYRGVTGFVRFDAAGDRVNACYDVWGYVEENGVTVCRRVGFVDGFDGSIVWLE